jgi:hypothetical protein
MIGRALPVLAALALAACSRGKIYYENVTLDFALAADGAAVEPADDAAVDAGLAVDGPAAADLPRAALDLAGGVDLAGADLAMLPAADLAMPAADLAMLPTPDLAMLPAPDLATPLDLNTVDLSPPLDLKQPVDCAGLTLDTVDNCGVCGLSCSSAGATSTSCAFTTVGYECKPACDPLHGDCDVNPANGCETNFSTGGACACDSCHADCDGNPANGCEVNACDDWEEPNEVCPGDALGTLEENSSTNVIARILPSSDLDTFTFYAHEGTHLCFPGTSQTFAAEVKVLNVSGLAVVDMVSCGDPAPSLNSTVTDVCIPWPGTCGIDDSRSLTVQVRRTSGAQSCNDYTLQIQFYAEGTACP